MAEASFRAANYPRLPSLFLSWRQYSILGFQRLLSNMQPILLSLLSTLCAFHLSCLLWILSLYHMHDMHHALEIFYLNDEWLFWGCNEQPVVISTLSNARRMGTSNSMLELAYFRFICCSSQRSAFFAPDCSLHTWWERPQKDSLQQYNRHIVNTASPCIDRELCHVKFSEQSCNKLACAHPCQLRTLLSMHECRWEITWASKAYVAGFWKRLQ